MGGCLSKAPAAENEPGVVGADGVCTCSCSQATLADGSSRLVSPKAFTPFPSPPESLSLLLRTPSLIARTHTKFGPLTIARAAPDVSGGAWWVFYF